MSTQSARHPEYAGGVLGAVGVALAVLVAVVLVVAVADGCPIGDPHGNPDGTAARTLPLGAATAAAVRSLVAVAAGVPADEAAACALTADLDALGEYELEVGLIARDAVAVVEAGVIAGMPPEETAEADTWTNSSVAPTAAMEAARRRVRRRDTDMVDSPQAFG